MSPVSRLHLLIVGSLLSFTFAEASVELVRIAALPGRFGGVHPCFDANDNQRYEIYGDAGLDQHHIDSLLIREYSGGDTFLDIRTGLVPGATRDVGNGDNDVLADMVTWRGGESLCVYESTAPDAYPSRLVWASTAPDPGSGVYAQFHDLDRDGLPEIVAAGWNGDGIMVFENRGDNAYEQVPFPTPPGECMVGCSFAVGDFDGDSLTDIVGGDPQANTLVYECTGDDQYARVCSLGYINEFGAYYWGASQHLDLAGNPGFVSLRERLYTGADSCYIRIYREPAHGQVVCVCSLTYAYAPFADQGVGCGDVDGDGMDEFGVSTGRDLRLFKCTGPDRFEQIWQFDRGSIPWLRFFDINRDGRVELIFTVPGDSTYIYEDTAGLSVAEFTKLPQPRSPRIQPTIVRLGAPVLFSGTPPDADIEVHSLDGRLVSRASGVRQSSWTWDLRDQAGNLVPAGTYFAVIRGKGKSTSLKLCLVK